MWTEGEKGMRKQGEMREENDDEEDAVSQLSQIVGPPPSLVRLLRVCDGQPAV